MDETAHQLQRYSLPLGGAYVGTIARLIEEGLPYGIVIWCDALLDVYAYRLCRSVLYLIDFFRYNYFYFRLKFFVWIF